MERISDKKKVCYHLLEYNSLSGTKDFLEKMAREGWLLEKISGGCKFIFKQIEPISLTYSINFFSQGSDYDTHLLENNYEYIEYCKKAGWEFAAATGNIHIFYDKSNEAKPIDTDPRLMLREINKLMLPSNLLAGIIMSIAALAQIIMSLTINLNVTEQSFFAFSNVVLWIAILCLWTYKACWYMAWYSKAKKAAEDGENLPECKYVELRNVIKVSIAIGTIYSVVATVIGVATKDYINFLVGPIWLYTVLLLYMIYKFRQISEEKDWVEQDLRCLRIFYCQ